MIGSLTFAALMLTPPAEPVALDDLIVFADAARCVPAAPLKGIVEQFDAWRTAERRAEVLKEGDGNFGVPERFRPAFIEGYTSMWGNNGRVTISRSVEASWRGLPLASIAVDWAPGRAKPALQLFFPAPLAEVRHILKAQGVIGRGRDAQVEANGIGTLMTCTLNG